MLSLFSSNGNQSAGDKQEASSFDFNSLLGSVSSNPVARKNSGSKSGVENSSKTSGQNQITKVTTTKTVVTNTTTKTSSNDKRPQDNHKKPGHSSDAHRRDDSDRHKSSKDQKSSYEEYNPLSNKSQKPSSHRNYDDGDYGPLDTFDIPIKKKGTEEGGNSSPKIKKVAPPSSIKKVEAPPVKRPEVSSSKKPDAPPTIKKSEPLNPKSRPPERSTPSNSNRESSLNTSTSKTVSKSPSSQNINRDQGSKIQRPDTSNRPKSSDKPPLNSSSSKTSNLNSSALGPLKARSQLPKTTSNDMKSSKPSSGNSSFQKPAPKPASSNSMTSKPLAKPSASSQNSRPVSSQSQSMVKKPMPNSSQLRPGTVKPGQSGSNGPRPVPGKMVNGKPVMNRDAMAKANPNRSGPPQSRPLNGNGVRPGNSTLTKRPLDNKQIPSRLEPGVAKKVKTNVEKKQTLNSVFKGSGSNKHSKRHAYDDDDDDEYEKDSFIDDGEEDQEAQEELGKIFSGYRKTMERRKHLDKDIDGMDVGFDQIEMEEEYSKRVGREEDYKQFLLIQKEAEEEARADKLKKRKLKID